MTESNKGPNTWQQTAAAKTANKLCLHCNEAIVDKSKSIKCSMCKKRIHFLCAESGVLNETVFRAMKLKYVMHYICTVCSPQPLKGKLTIEDANGNSQVIVQLKEQLKVKDEVVSSIRAESERMKQRNTQLEYQLSEITGEPSRKELDDKQKQLDENEVVINSLMSKMEMLKEKLHSKNQQAEQNVVISLDEKDMIIASLNKKVDTLNTQVSLLMQASRLLQKGKRPREDTRENSQEDTTVPLNEPMETNELMNDPPLVAIEKLITRLIAPLKTDIDLLKVNQHKGTNFSNEFPPIRGRPNNNGKRNEGQRNISNQRGVSGPRAVSVQGNNQNKNARATSKNRENRNLNMENKTFAEIIANSKTKPSFIRNVKINGTTQEEIDRISKHLSNNYICQDVGIKTINNKARDFITIKCKSNDDAVKLESTLKSQYGSELNITNVKDSDPKFKIIGVSMQDLSSSQILLNLKEQNDWLTNADLAYVDSFEVPNKNGFYTNIVIACDIPTLRRVLEKGSVICGLNMKKVYEHIEILQCFKCQRFGHIASACKSDPICKFCGGDHESKLCGEKQTFSCSNCIREIKNGAKINAGHKATDERCPMRSSRINGLKNFASKN